MTPPELRATLERAVAECRAAELPELVGLFEAAKVRAMARALGPAPATSDVVGVDELAAELHLAPSWLRAAARSGTLPSLKCGKHWRFHRSEVLGVLGEHRIATPVSAKKLNTGAEPLPQRYRAERR